MTTSHFRRTGAHATAAGATAARAPASGVVLDRREPAVQAFWILQAAFTIAPILFGLDKFFGLLVNWDMYLAPAIAGLSPMGVHETMYVVGVVEILAGVLVALHPRLGAAVVALWLAGIIVNLLLIPGYFDVALRDFGLLLGAVALQRLAMRYGPRSLTWPLHR